MEARTGIHLRLRIHLRQRCVPPNAQPRRAGDLGLAVEEIRLDALNSPAGADRAGLHSERRQRHAPKHFNRDPREPHRDRRFDLIERAREESGDRPAMLMGCVPGTARERGGMDRRAAVRQAENAFVGSGLLGQSDFALGFRHGGQNVDRNGVQWGGRFDGLDWAQRSGEQIE